MESPILTDEQGYKRRLPWDFLHLAEHAAAPLINIFVENSCNFGDNIIWQNLEGLKAALGLEAHPSLTKATIAFIITGSMEKQCRKQRTSKHDILIKQLEEVILALILENEKTPSAIAWSLSWDLLNLSVRDKGRSVIQGQKAGVLYSS